MNGLRWARGKDMTYVNSNLNYTCSIEVFNKVGAGHNLNRSVLPTFLSAHSVP